MTLQPATGPSNASRRPRGAARDVLLALVLLLVTFVIYSPALRGGLLFDDDEQLTKPSLRSLEGLGRIWFEPGVTQQYFPLTHTAFWVEGKLWGDAVLGYHVVSVLWHCAAALLLVRVVRQLGLSGAWVAAFLFALHPVATESVAWIAEQKNTLSAMLYVAAASAYLHFTTSRRSAHYAVASALFLLALLAKTSTAVLVPVLAVVAWWRHGRIRWRADALPLVPWLAAAIALGLITIAVEQTLIAEARVDVQLGLLEASIVAGRAILFYLGKVFWPLDLTMMYPRWAVDPSDVRQYVPVALVVAIAAGLLMAGRRFRGAAAAWLAFIAALGPFLGCFAVEWFAFGYVADHFQYLAMIALIVPVSAVAVDYATAAPAPLRLLTGAAMVGILAALAALTYWQSALYRDAETRYRATLQLNPTASVAANNLGAILLRRPGGHEEAVALFRQAIAFRPDFVEAHNNLANASALAGEFTVAVEHYTRALRYDPSRAAIFANLANTLIKMPGRRNDAIAAYEKALLIEPDLAEAQAGLGAALLAQPERLSDAIRHLETAIALKPEMADAHLNLGSAWLAVGGADDRAIDAYERALALAPESAEAHYNLALALLRANQRDLAHEHLRTAARLRPEWEQPALLLRRLLARE